MERAPTKAVIFDWAGTTIDFGSIAPVTPFIEAFARKGVTIARDEARTPMGLAKRDHIAALAGIPAIGDRWRAVHDRSITGADIDALFADFLTLQDTQLLEFAEPIPGVPALMDALRARALKIGSTTGYDRKQMERLAPEAARRGYAPDCWVTPTDVAAGRPYPWMCFENAQRLRVYPMASVVKVGDTVPDIHEGRNASAWTVAVACTGNEIGLPLSAFEALAEDERTRRVDEAVARLSAAGAHYVIDSAAGLLPILDEINDRLRRGESP